MHRWVFPFLVLLAPAAATAEEVDIARWLKPVQAVGPKGEGHRAAAEAWKQLARADASQIPEILSGMSDENPLSVNWLRAAVDTVAGSAVRAGRPLPAEQLEQFVLDKSRGARARRTAYELLLRADPQAEQRLIPGMLNDASLELRRDAVQKALDSAAAMAGDNPGPAAKAAYRKAFAAARDEDQIKAAADQLAKLGDQVDIPAHYGFVMQWRLAAPFDNTDAKAFDIAYGPELDPTRNAYDGKAGKVMWVDHATEDAGGLVDLNKALERHKGAVCYALAEFQAAEEQACELRLGCINANKVWLNGDLLISNNVYHSGSKIDQYRGAGRLKAGKNVILVKILQNEQEEQWAQRWEFQLRVCDSVGTAILSTDRPVAKAAAAPLKKTVR